MGLHGTGIRPTWRMGHECKNMTNHCKVKPRLSYNETVCKSAGRSLPGKPPASSGRTARDRGEESPGSTGRGGGDRPPSEKDRESATERIPHWMVGSGEP